MLPAHYQTYIDEASKQLPEVRKLFALLKKRKPANLDAIMADLHEEAFDAIDCLQCARCCATLGPRITDRDITRMAKSLRYKPSQLADSYLKIDEDGDYVFKTMPCPFLGADNYCAVYPDRPQACSGYPHTDRRRFVQLLDITLLNIKICPAVALISLMMINKKGNKNLFFK